MLATLIVQNMSIARNDKSTYYMSTHNVHENKKF